jgi:hypothetical protein
MASSIAAVIWSRTSAKPVKCILEVLFRTCKSIASCSLLLPSESGCCLRQAWTKYSATSALPILNPMRGRWPIRTRYFPVNVVSMSCGGRTIVQSRSLFWTREAWTERHREAWRGVDRREVHLTISVGLYRRILHKDWWTSRPRLLGPAHYEIIARGGVMMQSRRASRWRSSSMTIKALSKTNQDSSASRSKASRVRSLCAISGSGSSTNWSRSPS